MQLAFVFLSTKLHFVMKYCFSCHTIHSADEISHITLGALFILG